MIKTSLFANKDDRDPKPYETSCFSDFCSALAPGAAHISTKQAKEELSAFSPVEYVKGKLRGKRNILRVHVAALDIDGITQEQFALLLQCLEGLSSLIYTTFGHPKAFRAAEPRYKLRVLVELSEPVSGDPRHWKNFWLRLNQRFAGLIDPSTKDASRIFFGPFCAAGEEEQHFLYRFEGEPLSVSDLKAAPLQINVDTVATNSFPRDMLQKLARKYSLSTDTYRSWLGQVLSLVGKGEIYANPGERDTVSFKLACALAEAYPKTNAKEIGLQFGASLALMTTTEADCLTCGDIEEKVRRKQQEILEDEINKEEDEEEKDKLALLKAFQGRRATPYTEQELELFASKQACSVDELRTRWVLQHRGAYYVYYQGEYYAHTKDDFASAALVRLAPAQTAGVQLRRLIGKEVVPLGPKELVDNYGTVVDSHVMSYTERHSFYDPRQNLFLESVGTLRDLEPTYDPIVDWWLRLLGGEHYAALQEWLAGVTMQDKASAALLLIGKKGSGKGLLVSGLARLWSERAHAARLKDVLGTDFNQQLTTTPLIFADEALPTDFRGKGKTAELREFLQAASHDISMKHKPPATLMGYVRVVVAANNENLFDIHEHLTGDDIAAIAQRFCRINCGQESTDYLEILGAEEAKDMIFSDRIAKHVLHLAERFPPDRRFRFIAGGQGADTAKKLTTMNPINSVIFQRLVDIILSPSACQNHPKAAKFFLINKEGVWINSKAIQDTWAIYSNQENSRCPTIRSIGLALSACSTGGSKRRSLKTHPQFSSSGIVHYYKIALDILGEWCKTHNYASYDELVLAQRKAPKAEKIGTEEQ